MGLLQLIITLVMVIAVIFSKVDAEFQHIGCYKDAYGNRALPQNLGDFTTTKDTAIQKCADLAQQKRFTTFALQYGGQCWSGATAYKTYDKYGPSPDCTGEYGEGLGGIYANDVYKLPEFQHIGCYKDAYGNRALPQNLGDFTNTKDTAIQKCADLAQQKGFTTFALQYGGQCWSGATAYKTYDKYGPSPDCTGEYGEGLGGIYANDVYKLTDTSSEFAAAHIPQLRFDGGASNNCFPDEATDSNDNQCKGFNSNAPIYYAVRDCGDYRKLVWWIWYGFQPNCDCCSGSHGNDWEHITINFIKDGSSWKQDSVTWFQHDGWYTRSNTDEHPKIYVGKSAHGSYDNWCDGKGASWQQDYCPGGCGYWNDYRNDKKTSPWIPHNIKPVTEVTGNVANRVKDEKYFHNTELNKCVGGDWRCVKGPCGCWRNNRTFPAPQCDL